jgi:hypothetical protein
MPPAAIPLVDRNYFAVSKIVEMPLTLLSLSLSNRNAANVLSGLTSFRAEYEGETRGKDTKLLGNILC